MNFYFNGCGGKEETNSISIDMRKTPQSLCQFFKFLVHLRLNCKPKIQCNMPLISENISVYYNGEKTYNILCAFS